MPTHKLPLIEIGYQVFTSSTTEEFGAVRQVVPGGRPEIVIYIENAGDFVIPLDAVLSVHDQKVVVEMEKLSPPLREAIAHAHDSEQPGL